MYRKLREDDGQFNRVTVRAIQNLGRKFEETRCLGDRVSFAGRLVKNNVAVSESVAEGWTVVCRMITDYLNLNRKQDGAELDTH